MAPPKLQRLSVSDAVAAYLSRVQDAAEEDSLSAATARNYARDLAEFVDLVGGDRILDDITGHDVDQVVKAYRQRPDGRYATPPIDPETRKPITRGVGAQARFRQSVSRLFSQAVLEGWVEMSPMPYTKVKPRAKGQTNAARRALDEDAAGELLDRAADAGSPPAGEKGPRRGQRLGIRDTFILRVLMEVGPRVSELCNADRADLQRRRDGTVWLTLHGKGNKDRQVPLSAETYQAWVDYRDGERPTPRPRMARDPETGEPTERVPAGDAERALLLTWRGLRMRPRDVQYMVDRYCRALPDQARVTPHGLRHTAATLLLASGAADVHTVKELLGHASIATTGIYLDTKQQEMAAAVSMHPVTGRGSNS